jgi:hypothetical protein
MRHKQFAIRRPTPGWPFLLAIFLCVGTATAVEKKPLPDFQVTSPQGHPFSSLQLTQTNRWLLVVLTPSDPLSDRLLLAFHQWPESRWISKTIWIVEAPADLARTYLESKLGDSAHRISWVSDEPRLAFQSLSLKGLPVVIGMDQSQMQWTLSGVLNDPSRLESIVESWVHS